MSKSDVGARGTVVIGTVKGDVHDIGKNIVAIMLKGSGFTVHDLGVDVPAERFVEAIQELQPDVLGISALLTTTMPAMQVVIDALVAAGLRDQVKVLVGGAPVTEEFAQSIGADGYGRDAGAAAEQAKQLILAAG
jgi:methylmalonyl-CoA mutase cobalamin-binding domain/chain